MNSRNQVSVFIPTRNRPVFLREALSSIRSQTAVGRIAQVVVSENSGVRDSEKVVAEFKDLPIRYVFREPALGILEHHAALLTPDSESAYAALLHDDDWWAPAHLELASAALDADTGRAATFANFFATKGPTYPADSSSGILKKNWRLWFAGGCNFEKPQFDFDLVDVLMVCLMDATFHVSTLMARWPVLQMALEQTLATKNEYDFDRPIPVLLAQGGGISFFTKPTTYIRSHPAQDSKQDSYLQGQGLPRVIQTTHWMRQNWPEETRLAAARFNQIATTMDQRDLEQLCEAIPKVIRPILISECGMNLQFDTLRPRNLSWFIGQLTPPGLASMLRRLH